MSSAVYPDLPGLDWPIRKTLITNPQIRTTPSGREWRTSMMLVPRYRYTLTYEFLRDAAALAEYQTLFGFAELRLGAYDSFLYTDPYDHAVTAQAFGLGDASTVAWPLVRTLGGSTMRVFSLNGPPAIYKDGVLQTSGYTVDVNTGLVTFTTAPAAGVVLTWTGAYYQRVRFDGDSMDFDNFMAGFWKTGQVKLLSVKP